MELTKENVIICLLLFLLEVILGTWVTDMYLCDSYVVRFLYWELMKSSLILFVNGQLPFHHSVAMAIPAANCKEINRILHVFIQVPTFGHIQWSVLYLAQDTFPLHLLVCILPNTGLVKAHRFKLTQHI